MAKDEERIAQHVRPDVQVFRTLNPHAIRLYGSDP